MSNSPGSTKFISIPKRDENFAEFIGIVLGDGNIFSYRRGKKISVHSVRIAGSSEVDKDYIENFVAPLSERLFGLKSNIVVHKKFNCVYAVLYSVQLVEFLSKHGLKPGNKIKNNVTIPRWIWKNDKFIKACIRGLIDTDGSLYELTSQGLYQLNFKNKNMLLLKDTRKAFLKLGFHVSRISKNNSIYLTRKEDLKKFYNEIGSNNPKNIIKAEKMLKTAPWCSGQTVAFQ